MHGVDSVIGINTADDAAPASHLGRSHASQRSSEAAPCVGAGTSLQSHRLPGTAPAHTLPPLPPHSTFSFPAVLAGREASLLAFCREALLCSSRTTLGGDTYDACELLFKCPGKVLIVPDSSNALARECARLSSSSGSDAGLCGKMVATILAAAVVLARLQSV